jgi:hypothetical protein
MKKIAMMSIRRLAPAPERMRTRYDPKSEKIKVESRSGPEGEGEGEVADRSSELNIFSA